MITTVKAVKFIQGTMVKHNTSGYKNSAQTQRTSPPRISQNANNVKAVATAAKECG
jgi:hypothetical protein